MLRADFGNHLLAGFTLLDLQLGVRVVDVALFQSSRHDSAVVSLLRMPLLVHTSPQVFFRKCFIFRQRH